MTTPVLLVRVPRKSNMYSFDLQNVVPSGDLFCLFTKASTNESNLWHGRLGHVNFKTMNKLVKGNLVRGLPSKIFNNDHSCVACQKGKQHKASSKWSCGKKNKTLIEAARTMLADSLLPITFWAEVVNTACYVLNRALVTKTQNKTPYELLNGRTPRLDFVRPFGYPVTILNTLDPLGKFEGKANEGFLDGYSVTSKAFKVFNTKTRKVKENMHVRFLKNKPNVAGTGPNWLFDIDSLTNSLNYVPVSARNQIDKNIGPQDTNDDKPADDEPKDDTGSKTVEEPVNKEDQAYIIKDVHA
nr:ribonuclease H-like domain-containing protein [Tanacetum cinerariifolium]